MTFGEQVTRTFEVRNEGLFEFKFALCDYKDDEAKKRIKEERLKEMEERIKGSEEKKEEVKDPKKKPEPAKAPPKKPDPKGGAPVAAPEGGALEVSQYTVSPAVGSIPPGSAAVFNVVFKAKGSQFYETTILHLKCIIIIERKIGLVCMTSFLFPCFQCRILQSITSCKCTLKIHNLLNIPFI